MTVAIISGYGRSGSTLIEGYLSSYSNIFPVGELRNIWLRANAGYLCSCGVPIVNCKFWSKVFQEVFPDEDVGCQIKRMEEVRKKYDRIRNFKNIISRDSCFDLDQYINVYEKLYFSVLKYSGAGVVLDSSKNPTHAAIMSKSNKISVKHIHLVRHPSAVVYSWKRKKIRKEISDNSYMPIHPSCKSSALWYVLNKQAGLLKGDRYFIKYEDFVSDVEESVRKLINFIGSEKYSTKTEKEFHTVGGNPIKFQSDFLTIKADYEWRENQGRFDNLISWVVCSSLAKKYGYFKNG